MHWESLGNWFWEAGRIKFSCWMTKLKSPHTKPWTTGILRTPNFGHNPLPVFPWSHLLAAGETLSLLVLNVMWCYLVWYHWQWWTNYSCEGDVTVSPAQDPGVCLLSGPASTPTSQPASFLIFNLNKGGENLTEEFQFRPNSFNSSSHHTTPLL